MKTLRPKTITTVGNDPLKEVISKGLNKYNRIRDGIIATFKNYDLAPIEMYGIATSLEYMSMMEYQNKLVEIVDQTIKGEERKIKEILFDSYNTWKDGSRTKVKECWIKILGILKMEEVKALQLSRISAEIRTSSMDNFIIAIGNYIDSQKGTENKIKEEKE